MGYLCQNCKIMGGGCRYDQITSTVLPLAGLAAGLYLWVSGEYKLILLKGDN